MSLLSRLHLLPRAFRVLVGATFVNRFGVFVVPFLALFITRNGNTAAQAGLAVAAYSLGGFGAAWIASLAPEEHVRALLRFSQLCLVCGKHG
jgi:hypothetical protein